MERANTRREDVTSTLQLWSEEDVSDPFEAGIRESISNTWAREEALDEICGETPQPERNP